VFQKNASRGGGRQLRNFFNIIKPLNSDSRGFIMKYNINVRLDGWVVLVVYLGTDTERAMYSTSHPTIQPQLQYFPIIRYRKTQ
jgi:hypothetical protein